MMNCIWQSRLIKKAKQFNPQLLLFQAHCRRQQLAKHKSKDDARPRAKAAYHCMNELEDKDLDEEYSANENSELSKMKTTVTVITTMCIVL